MGFNKIAWFVTVAAALITALLLFVFGYNGYGAVRGRARGYRRSGPPYGRASATTAAQPPQVRLDASTSPPSPRSRYVPPHGQPLRRPVESGQFVSLAFGQACAKAGIARSMGSRGDCWDNAVAESFFATLKKELIRRRAWPTRSELRTAVFEYIEIFYNATRRHSTLAMLSPAQFEMITHPNQIKDQDN